MDNLRRTCILLTLLTVAALAPAQTYLRYTNWCQKGGQRVAMQGINSTTKVQASYPGCTVTVYNAGTITKPFLFSDKLGTPLANPFTAGTLDGLYAFYVNSAAHYDVVTSGGGLPAPVTIFDVVLTDVGSGGGGGSVTGVTATAPVISSGGTAPVISLPQATAAQSGYLAAADWATFNSKGVGTVASVNMTVPAAGLAVSGNPITGSGTLVVSYNGQFPPTSLCSGSPTALNFCNGSGAWLPALTSSGSPVTSIVAGTNISLGFTGNALTVNSTGAVTYPIFAPIGVPPQISFLNYPEIGLNTTLSNSAFQIRQVVVGAVSGGTQPVTITITTPIKPTSWQINDTIQLKNLPASPTNLTSLNLVDFKITLPTGSTPTSTIQFLSPTTITPGTYAVTAGSASIYDLFLQGHGQMFSRLDTSTSNGAIHGSVRGARRDAWVSRSGAVDNTGMDVALIRGGVQINATNAVGAGDITASGTNNAGASSITVAKAAGASWSAIGTGSTPDKLLIAADNGDAELQIYTLTADTTVTQGTTTSIPITPNLRTSIPAGSLISVGRIRTQLGDASGVEFLGDVYFPDAASMPTGCLNITSTGLMASTGVACGAGSAVAGADKDVQLNVSGVFGVDTGIFTYNSSTSVLKVRNVLVNGANSNQNRLLYTIGGVTLTAGGAGTTVWGVDTDGFVKFCENNGACVRPGVGAGSGNVSNSGSPTSGQTAEFITDSQHITGVANTGTGSYVKGTAPTISLIKADTINDVNGKLGLTFTPTTNAVDGLCLTNAATASPATVSLTGCGTDTNISVNLISKGTGTVQCNGVACGGGGSSSYTNLFQTDANTLTQRNSGVTQVSQVMNSYTDSANYQGLAVGGFYVKTIKSGTGAALALQLGIDSFGTNKGWQIATNTFDWLPLNPSGLQNIGTATAPFRIGTVFATSADLTGALTATIANDTVTGTTTNKLAKLTGAPSKLIITGTSDTDFDGIVVSGAGLSGSAVLARSGITPCVFDGGTVAGDYVINSPTVVGDCHDTGSQTPPTSGRAAGRVQSTNASAGTYSVLVNLNTGGGSGGGAGTVTTFASGQLSPLFTTSVTNASTTPTQSFTLIAATANSLFGNNTAALAAPQYFTAALTAAPFGREGTSIQLLHGSVTGQFTFSPVNFATEGTGIVPPGNLGTGALSGSVFLNGLGQWATPAGGGNVSVTGTAPVNLQAAEWASPSTIRAVNTTGTSFYVKSTGPLLVGPQVNTILDANGNPFLASTATASAVDGFTFTNSATGSPATVTIGASGSDANINFLLTPKGTGLIQFSSGFQSLSAGAGAWQATEGIDPSLCIAGKDLFYASSTNHRWTMCNNGGLQQKVIGSSADISVADFVIGAHFPTVRAGDFFYNNGSTWATFAGNNSGTSFLCEDSTGTPSWCASSLSVAWSSIQPPASNTNISMGTFTTNLNYTSAVGNAFGWINTAAATSGTAQSSPQVLIQGSFWTGSATSPDGWILQDSIANGTNGASTFSIAHAGSAGIALVAAPSFKTTVTTANIAHFLSAQSVSTCSAFGVAGTDSLCGDATSWKLSIGTGAAVPVVGGPTSAPVSANLASFNGTAGSLIQDSGIAQGQVPTSAAVIASGNVVQGSGGVRGISDAGYAANTVITSAAIIASGNIPSGNGARGLTDSGIVTANVNFSSANITTDSIAVGSANSRQLKDSGILITNTFHTGTKADVTETNMRCQDAGANDTYTCNLSPAITAYVTGTEYGFKANTANTGAATINLNAVGALTIKKMFGGTITSDLADNDIRAGQWVYCVYDGTNCQMTSQIGNQPSSSGTVTSIATTSPITGGTITLTGTIGCATCVTSAASLTNNQLVFGAGSQGTAIGDLTGDVTTAGGKATTIASAAVTGGKIASSVALAGSPTTTTQSPSDNSTKVATTAYVDAAAGAKATVSQLSKTAAVSTFTLCAAATCGNGASHQYRIEYNIWSSGTACSVAGGVAVGSQLTWTDENSQTHTAQGIPFYNIGGTYGSTYVPTTNLATSSGWGQAIISTNGTIIQAATTYADCGTGTNTYNIRYAVFQLQ